MAALVAGVATAVLLAAWRYANDRAACSTGGIGSCAGAALTVALIGVPVFLVLVAWGLRRGGASHPVLGMLLVLVGSWVLVALAEAVDPPLGAWPFLVALVAGGYVLLETRSRRD